MSLYHDSALLSMGVALDDRSSTGRKRPWKEKKVLSEKVSASYERIGDAIADDYGTNWAYRKAVRVADCGSVLSFRKVDGDKLKLHRANFCRVRMCPMCSWRRSLRVFSQVQEITTELLKEKEFGFLFLTLTVKNCEADELSDTITALLQAYTKLTNRKRFKAAVKGTFRALEVTYNEKDNTFHPHIHAVLLVNKSYFTDKTYIKHTDWVDLWQGCLGLDYAPMVNIKRIKKDDLTVGRAIAETAKYAVKESDFISDNDKLMDYLLTTFDHALAGRRLVDFTGKFREAKRALKLGDTENGDLVNTSDEKVESVTEEQLVTYVWQHGMLDYLERR